MAWTFENSQKWSKFNELSSVVWRDGLGCAEWRKIGELLPADAFSHIPERDRYDARKMVCHAADALERATGFRA